MPMQQVDRRDPLTRYEFHARLREWLRQNEARIDGGAERDGRKPWIYVRDGSDLYLLHADAKRPGVESYLRLVDQYGDDLAWWPTLSQKGKDTAVAYGPNRQRVTALYLYRERRA